ncbi:MAG: glycosyltransferase family 1 protein [Gammaproteobacteria bacterium]|nr:MAG: glycosyltransferase family 1 protein [Gammaproteobacteria bacterium]
MKILFFVTEDWYFCSHRLPLAQKLVEDGHEVVLLSNIGKCREIIEKEKIRAINFGSSRGSLNPFLALYVVIRLLKIYLREKPDIIHQVSIKPVLLGSVAAIFIRKAKMINAITGLGWLYTSKSKKALVLGFFVRKVLRFVLNKGNTIVQNKDDFKWLTDIGVNGRAISLIRGSGVDIQQFYPVEKNPEKKKIRILLVARMLWDKGVEEFVNAAEKLSTKFENTEFVLVGDPDPSNKASIPESTLDNWSKSNVVQWLGRRNDIDKLLSESDIACLPSYREGLPKSLLEASAAGLPIVTTDVPGCREVVSDGENGFLVPVRDSELLANALEKLIIDRKIRISMGKRSRELAVTHFSAEKIIAETISLYEKELNK